MIVGEEAWIITYAGFHDAPHQIDKVTVTDNRSFHRKQAMWVGKEKFLFDNTTGKWLDDRGRQLTQDQGLIQNAITHLDRQKALRRIDHIDINHHWKNLPLETLLKIIELVEAAPELSANERIWKS